MTKSPPNDMRSAKFIYDVDGREGIFGGSGPMIIGWMRGQCGVKGLPGPILPL